jgi:hypothetical protein
VGTAKKHPHACFTYVLSASPTEAWVVIGQALAWTSAISGVSNYRVKDLEEVLSYARIKVGEEHRRNSVGLAVCSWLLNIALWPDH